MLKRRQKAKKGDKRIDSPGVLPYHSAMMETSDTLHVYFERALLRTPAALPLHTAWIRDEDGCVAVFRVRFRFGRVAEVDYRATTCATLLGLCEHLSELLPGMTESEVLSFSAGNLLSLHPEIPPGRRVRAELAIRALHAGCLSARRN